MFIYYARSGIQIHDPIVYNNKQQAKLTISEKYVCTINCLDFYIYDYYINTRIFAHMSVAEREQ